MRRVFTSLCLVTAFLLLESFGGGTPKYPGGSPGGYTNSPGDGANCTSCHNGSAANVTGWITSNVPVTGYVAGTAYTITVTVSGTGVKGFEVSPQSPSGALLGSLTAGTGTHLVNGNKAVTQSSSSSANPKVWTFTWTAPAAGTGPVTFYGAFALNKSATKISTTVIPESTGVGIPESSVLNPRVYPNPCTDYVIVNNISAKGGKEISLHAVDGKMIERLSSDANGDTEKINLPRNIKPGVYFLEIRTDQQRIVEKILIK